MLGGLLCGRCGCCDREEPLWGWARGPLAELPDWTMPCFCSTLSCPLELGCRQHQRRARPLRRCQGRVGSSWSASSRYKTRLQRWRGNPHASTPCLETRARSAAYSDSRCREWALVGEVQYVLKIRLLTHSANCRPISRMVAHPIQRQATVSLRVQICKCPTGAAGQGVFPIRNGRYETGESQRR